MRVVTIVSIAVLAGCSTTSTDFHQGGRTEQFQYDSAACEAEGVQSRNMPGYGSLTGVAYYYYNWLFDACMRSKGYASR